MHTIRRQSPTSSPPRISSPATVVKSNGSIYDTTQGGNALGLRTPPVPPRRQTSSESLLKARNLPPRDYSNHHIKQLLLPGNADNFSEDSDSESDSPRIISPPLPPRRAHQSSGNHSSPRHSFSGSSSSLRSSSSDVGTVPDVETTPRPPLLTIPSAPPLPTSPRPQIRRETSFEPLSPTASSAPHLPIRRGTAAVLEDTIAPLSPGPLLPPRPPTSKPTLNVPASVSSQVRLPPPARTIALGEKLPAVRPILKGTGDSSDEEDRVEESMDLMPDTSRTSRRPPALNCFQYNDTPIHIKSTSGGVAIAAGAAVVVGSHHHIEVYELSVSKAPVHTWSLSNLHMKEATLISIALPPSSTRTTNGIVVWVGTKEGHLFEVDVRAGMLLGSKRNAHGHSITHIFRHERSMLTLDSSGRMSIFTPEGSEDVSLDGFPPRLFKTNTEKPELVKMIGNQLWTATRAEVSERKSPIIRIHDIYDSAKSGFGGRQIAAPDGVGGVTSAAVLPCAPQKVYVGHENGIISVWSIASGAPPHCIETVKVSATAVVSLEAVNDRIWAGGRQGAVTVYNVSSKPWVATNSWIAHKEAPVLQLLVDPTSLEQLGRVAVMSIGKDQQVRLWDGLLSADWIGEYSSFFGLTLLLMVASQIWNSPNAKLNSAHLGL